MRRFVLCMTLLGTSGLGCEDAGLSRLPVPEVQIDELKQQPAALVDILWVVDNSGTMVQEQAALADNFDRFITGLTRCPTGMDGDLCDFTSKTCMISGQTCNPPDYHIGVISTDITSEVDTGRLRKIGVCTASAGADPDGGKYRYCQGSNQDCVHDPDDPNSDPQNTVCDMTSPLSFVTPDTPNGAGAFARAVQVGVQGSGRETGIEAAAIAVGRQTNRETGTFVAAPEENAGFLRDRASLFVIFVSDEDDNSFGEVTYFYRAFETLRNAGNEGVVSISAIVGDPDLDGNDGPDPGGCPVGSPDLTATPGSRYIALAMYSRSLADEFQVCDQNRLTCGADTTCARPLSNLPGICLPRECTTSNDCGNFRCVSDESVDVPCAVCEGGTCTLDAPRFPQLLEQNGIFGSICSEDYGDVLDPLGFEAAGLSRKFDLTKFPDCRERVACCPSNTTDCGVEVPVCVKVEGEVVVNQRNGGWIYERNDNAIFFDGSLVPPTDADIEVTYKAALGLGPVDCNNQLQ